VSLTAPPASEPKRPIDGDGRRAVEGPLAADEAQANERAARAQADDGQAGAPAEAPDG
jgi:hypothetical protein